MEAEEKAKAEQANEKEVPTTQPQYESVTRCTGHEGGTCVCAGTVFYGEKYDRFAKKADQTRLSFEEMMEYPTLNRSGADANSAVIACTYAGMHDPMTLEEIFYDVKTPKQCFCARGKYDGWRFLGEESQFVV